MIFRQAKTADIKQLHTVRLAVKENVLNNPSLVKEEDYVAYLNTKGKGWVCEMDNRIVGFAILNFTEQNIWALFVLPDYEGIGIGSHLMDTLLQEHFNKNKEGLWLNTAPGTRAENFYRKSGWKPSGTQDSGEIRFELSYMDWKLFWYPYCRY